MLKKDNLIGICLNCIFFGFFLIASLPIGFSFAVDLTHPVSEALNSGFLMVFATVWGTIYSYTASWILDID